jgi:hypothetical protein
MDKPVIDGVLNEEEWMRAKVIQKFWAGGAPRRERGIGADGSFADAHG